MNILKFTPIAIALIFLSGCNGGKNQTNIELVQDMMDQVSLKSQDYDYVLNHPSMLTPPEGTVPRNFTPYPYPNNQLEAEKKLMNPFAHDNSAQILERGKNRYDIFCSVCHGITGKGDGTAANFLKMRPPPPLVSDKVKAFNDGRIFHIMTDGQGLMNGYGTQIFKAEDRWAIVNYIRTLQK